MNNNRRVSRSHYGTLSFGNIRVLSGHSTHKCRAIAISKRLAVIFGLIEIEPNLTDPKEFKFVNSALSLQLMPDVPPGTQAYTVDVDVKEILVLPSLQKDQIILSEKIGMVPIRGVHMAQLKWTCTLQVKDLRTAVKPDDTITALIKAALDYNVEIPEERYLNARRYIKRLFQDYHAYRLRLPDMGSEFNSLRFEKTIVRLSRTHLNDLWEETLKYNRRYAKGNLMLKWFAFLTIGKAIGIDGERIFSPSDLSHILDSIIMRKAVWELKELIKNHELVRAFAGPTMRTALTRVRDAGYFKSPSLAIFLLDHCEPYYTLEWVRKDLIALITLASCIARVNTSAVQRFMEYAEEIAPGHLSESWLRLFLDAVRICEMRIPFDEWQATGYFGTFLALLYAKQPEYFMQADWRTFKDAKHHRHLAYADLKDAILETTSLLPLLRIQRPHSAAPFGTKGQEMRALAPIKLTIGKMKLATVSFVAKESMKVMLQAVDFWLQVTGFADEIVLLGEHHQRTRKLSHTGVIAIALCEEILAAYRHTILLKKNVEYDPTMILRVLSLLQLSRLTLLMVWSGTVPIPLDPPMLAMMARYDVYGLGNAVWAGRRVDPERSVEAMAAVASTLTPGTEPDAHAFSMMYASVGPPISNPCRLASTTGRRVGTRILSWSAPNDLVQGRLDHDMSLALIRLYLLLKLGIPLGITRSNLSLIGSDKILPFEYAQMMNFWLDRYCALTAPSAGTHELVPAYKIVIPGADPEAEMDVLID